MNVGLQGQYRARGFTEVVTPNMYNKKLWETSGHWQHYAVCGFPTTSERDVPTTGI